MRWRSGLIFGVMRLINFAQGDFLMLGNVFRPDRGRRVRSCRQRSARCRRSCVAAGLSLPVFFVFGWLLHVGLLGLIEKSGRQMTEGEIHQTQLIMTLGISLVLANGALMVFGSTPASINTPLASQAWILCAVRRQRHFSCFFNKARVLAALCRARCRGWPLRTC